jgi:hypothetical protein
MSQPPNAPRQARVVVATGRCTLHAASSFTAFDTASPLAWDTRKETLLVGGLLHVLGQLPRIND